MAGPSVAVRFIGDTSDLSKSLDDTGQKTKAAAGGMKDAFSGFLNTINQTGVLGPFGSALDGVDQAIGAIIQHAKGIGPAMQAAGGAVAGVGLGLTALGSADQAAHQQLQAAVEATGQSYDDYGKQVDDAIKSQEKFGYTADQTQDALKTLTQATGDPAQALQLLGEASDLAASKHEDLGTAATQLGKVYNGNTKLLTQYHLSVEKVKKGTTDVAAVTKVHNDNLQALGRVLQGQASAGADTFTGKLRDMKAQITDQVSEFGQKYGPAITAAGVGVTALGSAVEIAGSATKIWTGIQAAFDAVMDANPIILVVLAIAGLIALVVLAYTHFQTFRDVVQDAGKVIGDVFNAVKDIAKDVIDWLHNNWELVLAVIIAGPFGAALVEIQKHWGDIMSFLKGLPGDIESVFKDIWSPISGAFKDVINAVIDVWNKLHFTLPKVDVLGVHIGGETIGVPQIPHLQTGGYIASGGLAMLHAGETVVPAGVAPAPGGPAVLIHDSVFNSATDVDLIAKKLEFALRAGLRLA